MLQMTLSKERERWWESMLDIEPKLEMDKIDCTRDMDEMSEAEHMKIEEIMWNQRQKELGMPTTTDEQRKVNYKHSGLLTIVYYI